MKREIIFREVTMMHNLLVENMWYYTIPNRSGIPETNNDREIDTLEK